MINSIGWIVFGDSIGLGVAQAAGLPFNAKVGRQPHEVEREIASTPGLLIRDCSVILSCGISNNPAGLSHAYAQIALLLEKGAARVVVLGVGPGNDKVDLTGVNDKMRDHIAIACAGQPVLFVGPITNTRDGVHPWSFDQLVDQIEAALTA